MTRRSSRAMGDGTSCYRARSPSHPTSCGTLRSARHATWLPNGGLSGWKRAKWSADDLPSPSLAFVLSLAASNAGGGFRKHRRHRRRGRSQLQDKINGELQPRLGNGRNYDIIHAASISLDGGNLPHRKQTCIPQDSHNWMIQGFVSAFVAMISQVFLCLCPSQYL